jgi:hypothetical protein
MNNEAQEVLLNIELQAKKLAVLIYDSNMPQDVKEAWAAFIPEMDEELIGELSEMLEAKFVGEETQAIDDELKARLESIKNEHESLRRSLDLITQEKLKIFESTLDCLS